MIKINYKELKNIDGILKSCFDDAEQTLYLTKRVSDEAENDAELSLYPEYTEISDNYAVIKASLEKICMGFETAKASSGNLLKKLEES